MQSQCGVVVFSMDTTLTREEADLMALAFLRDHGPHTMEPIEDESGLGAALIFLELERKNLVTRTDYGGGRLQFAITDVGRAALA